MLKLIGRVVAGSAVMVGLLVSPAAPVVAHEDDNPLQAVKKATAQFHDVKKAEHAGYGKLLSCFDNPGVGGMGQHYVNGSLMDATAIATKPEAMVYEVDGDELHLVAVEYIIPYSFVPATAKAPRLFGHAFLHNDALSLWALHAWIWKHNPLGMFATWNPDVDLCPGHDRASAG